MRIKPPSKTTLRVFSLTLAIVMSVLVILSAVFPFPEETWQGKILSIGLGQSISEVQAQPSESHNSRKLGFGWSQIDFTISGSDFIANHTYNTTFPSSVNSGSGFVFGVANHTLTYYLSGGKMQWTSADATKTKSIGAILSSTGVIQADGLHNKVAYAGAFLNTTVEYRAYTRGVKEYFVLSELPYNDGKIPDSYLEYTGELAWDSGLSVWVDGIEYPDKTFNTSSSVDFRDITTNETVFSLLAPLAWDSSNLTCSAVYDVKVSAGKVQYGLRIPYSWLHTATFPVIIDPSFTARTETYYDDDSLGTPYTFTINKPTGTANGDILFCWIAWYTASAITIDSVPSGWALAGDYTANADKYALYWKVAASEGASWDWSFDGDCQVRAVCSCYTGGDFDPDDPIDVVSNTAYRTSDYSAIAASMTVAAANSPLVFWAGTYSTSIRTFTKPTTPVDSWVEDDDAGSTTSDFSTEVCSMIWSGSGATGAMTATISVVRISKHAFAVALNPAAACSPNISLNTSSWSVNGGTPVTTGSNYATGLTYFRITNNSGGAVTITIHGTDMTGGGYTWDLDDSGSAGNMIYALKAGLSGGDYTIIVKEVGSTPYNTLKSGLADSGTQDFGLKLWTPTAYSDGNAKSGNSTLTVACD